MKAGTCVWIDQEGNFNFIHHPNPKHPKEREFRFPHISVFPHRDVPMNTNDVIARIKGYYPPKAKRHCVLNNYGPDRL